MIKFICEDDLLELKNNRSILFRDVVSAKNGKLEEVFHNPKIIRDTKVSCEDFQLTMELDKPELTDLENVKRVHRYMGGLSESQASDERIWVAYSLSVFSDYMRYRWNPDSEKAMMNRYFFSYSPKRSLFRHGIARLWWIGHLTYDKNQVGDEFELTKYVCQKQDNINLLLDINFGNNPTIVRAVIRALIDAEKEGIQIEREDIRQLSEYINTLGGVYLIDAFSYEFIYNKCRHQIDHIKQ